MRIVSLCPSLTELVFDLGRGSELVGITQYCVHPAEALARIEALGGTKNPDVTRIVDLAPDLVLLNEEENRREDAQVLARAGIACHTSLPHDAQETALMVRSIGAALGTRERAEALAADIERRAERVRAEVASARHVPFAYLIWRKPWMSVNGDTYASALLELAGGRNVFAGEALRYPEISTASLASLEPERVFLCTEPFGFLPRHADELALETGITRERFVIADGEYLSWHGSRTPAGIDYAAQLLRDARR
ncbi:MAG: ABC transporter substrate-binding protein [Planctomycetes bacterium]|nr:ABC transporter substrate-binding protein [Planctomycetota bacterium]